VYMSNNWIKFVKQVQKERNVSYKDALILSKGLYSRGKSVNSEIVANIFYKNPDKFDVSKIKNASIYFKAVKKGVRQKDETKQDETKQEVKQ